MATKKISELILLDTVDANLQLTIIPVLDTSSGTTKKVTLQQINDSIEANIPFAAAAFTQANTPSHVANSASSYANASFSKANTPSHVANSASSYANSAFVVANTANSNAISASQYANAAFAAANNSVDTWVRDSVNASSSYANSGFSKANTANSNVISASQYANAAYGQANTSNTLAQQSYDTANTKVSKSGDTMTGNLTFSLGGGILANVNRNEISLTSNVINDLSGFIAYNNGVSLVYGNTGVQLVANTGGGGATSIWNFKPSGILEVPSSGTITAPINQEFQLQAKDTNSVSRNEINLDPNNGTYMSVWSDETTSFSSANWGSASWNNESGLGAARFTDAQALRDFWIIGLGSIGLTIEASINGGARTPVFYESNNGEQYGVELGVDAVPPGGQGTTIPITSLIFYYRTQSKINIDRELAKMLLDAQSMDFDLRTTENLDLRSGRNLNLRSLGQQPVRIYTDDTTHMWEFDSAGSLTLPREGKIYGIGQGTASDRTGYISWAGNTSGDGAGYNTMRLVPDIQGLESADQYIILDPTSPGHIHIRAGGTQDNSQAILYFGGENSHVKIDSGPNPAVTVMANNKSWSFGTNGNLTFPNSNVQTGAAISITELKALVANCATYGDFQTAIANL